MRMACTNMVFGAVLLFPGKIFYMRCQLNKLNRIKFIGTGTFFIEYK